ncbi:MAG: type II toxin-antitoxin system prevent-host-death family antitoxin [Candidatus Neomarinimicrobiota bacterium]
MNRLATSELREGLADALNRVAYRGERILLQRRGKDVAALVPKEDLALLEALEDHSDVIATLQALNEPGAIPWEKVKEELGL